jgi:hypothetical protein
MNYIRDKLFAQTPTLTVDEQADKDEQEWYDNYVGWCEYDEIEKVCKSYKFMIGNESIISSLFTMFNEFLYSNENIVMKISRPTKVLGFYPTGKTVPTAYFIREDAAKQFITTVLKDDWENYLLLNKDVYKKSLILVDQTTPYALLDAFVYGFSRYNDMMKVASFDEEPIPNMYLKSKEEPIQHNAVVHARTPQMSNSRSELRDFETYLKKTPSRKTSFIRAVLNKLPNTISMKRNKKINSKVSNTSVEMVSNTLTPYFNFAPKVETNDKISTNVLNVETNDEGNTGANIEYKRRVINTSKFKKDIHGMIIDGGKNGKKKTHVPRKKTIATSVKTNTVKKLKDGAEKPKKNIVVKNAKITPKKNKKGKETKKESEIKKKVK